MVEAVEEHLGQVVHRLPVLRWHLSELVDYEVGDALGYRGLLERWSSLEKRQHLFFNSYSQTVLLNLQQDFPTTLCRGGIRAHASLLLH